VGFARLPCTQDACHYLELTALLAAGRSKAFWQTAVRFIKKLRCSIGDEHPATLWQDQACHGAWQRMSAIPAKPAAGPIAGEFDPAGIRVDRMIERF
jgi:hypothetical protein